jgi:membrane associated rhomboid family serine protease
VQVLTIIAITCVVSFVAWMTPGMVRTLAECPYEIVHRQRVHQLVTSAFVHADIGHLFFNMLTLYFFGPPMLQILGARGFMALYFGSLLAGSLLTFVLYHRDQSYRAVGASGAVTGVIFSYVLYQPLAPIYLFLLPIGIPAVLFGVIYVAISIVGAKRRMGRIGHAAHLGGAIGGVITTIALDQRVVTIFLSHFSRLR